MSYIGHTYIRPYETQMTGVNVGVSECVLPTPTHTPGRTRCRTGPSWWTGQSHL